MNETMELLKVFDLDKRLISPIRLPYGKQRKLRSPIALTTNQNYYCLTNPAAVNQMKQKNW